MENNFKKLIISLELLSGLKKEGLLNQTTGKALLTAWNMDDPSKEYEAIQNAIMFSKMFHSPFDQPDESIDGPLRFAFSENKQVVGLFPHDCHVFIAGQTGTGKSTLLKIVFTEAMLQNNRMWLFVRSTDMRNLLLQDINILVITFDDTIKFNPLNPCGLSNTSYCNMLADIICQSNNVYDGSKNYILEYINPLYEAFALHRKFPSLLDLYYKLRSLKHPLNSRTARYRESVLNRLGGMLYGKLGKVFDCSVGHEQAFFENNCIFEIDTLTTEQQRFIVNLLLTKLFYHRQHNHSDDWMFVGIDDANLIFDASLENRFNADLPIIHHLLTTVRKSKINIFACSQTPHQVGASIHSNSFAKIMFSLSNGKDIECMQQSMGIKDPEQKAYCYKLKPREAIVKFSSRYQEPFLAITPEVEL